ncbi:hypothetical protein Tdes44962_MAKER04016 [Teratosphaeria destructans]|uniref:DUF7918 domain-containing protein n=1 Tax=Teratosphaeria destructans TaxID=418781 RepID=A0A9W7W102_9PEZI|nr:hypothetical protein Tdes44962_MAKER04016 [Teratosphaeria destructans]
MKFTDFSDLQVSLKTDGVELAEFDDEDGEFPRIDRQTKFVEATSGANFTVELHCPHQLCPNDYVSCCVKLDGQYVTSSICEHRRNHRPITIEGRRAFGSDGRPTLQRFAFAELHTNDSTAKSDLKEDFRHLGTIQLDFYKVLALEEIREASSSKWSGVGAEGVPEKGLKGLSEPETMKHPFSVMKVEYPYGKKPFLSAIYKYRSRRDLQIEGIIPSSPSPVPLEERDPDDLTPEEARELVRRLRERQVEVEKEATHEKRSRESIAIDRNEVDVTIASENGPSNKRPRLTVEIVDLTDD